MDVKGKFRYVFVWLCFVVLHSSQLICNAQFIFHPESLWRGTIKNHGFKGDPVLCADDNWNLNKANLLCKKMGFSEGAMYFKEGTISSGDSTINCHFASADFIPCEGREEPCDKAAWVACQLPGYRGCYSGQTLPGYSEVPVGSPLTIETCLTACRSTDTTYAALSGGQRCYCSNQPPGGVSRDEFCDDSCPGDENQVCGGISPTYSAVYETFLGSCEGSVTSNKGYLASPGFPGDRPSVSKCTWNFETSYYNLTSVRVIGADTGGVRKLVTIQTKAIHDQLFYESMITYDIERSEVSSEIWRNAKIEYEAEDHLIYRNVSATFTPSNNLAFLLTLEVNQVDFEIPTTTRSPNGLTTLNRSTCKQTSLFHLLLILVFGAGCLQFLDRT